MKKIGLGILLTVGLTVGVMGNRFMINEASAEEGAISYSAKIMDNVENHLEIRAKSAYLMDFGTETQVYAKNEKTHLPIASMCKIMTLILAFDAVNAGVIDINEEIVISERAASMGGSQVFLEAGAKYKVSELIKSIVVCSANDSCVALAEKICGNEQNFIDKMNEKAKEIGACDTLFANCTGLPKDPQYSCAKDVALMLKELLKNPKYYEFGKVWMDKFSHPEGRFTEITNTNKLVRFYEGCDGGKTGFTNQAGFCLAATAKRGDMRVISVIIGAENSANRFEDTKTMFNYAFENYAVEPVVEADKPITSIDVNGGKQKAVSAYPLYSSHSFFKRGESADIALEIKPNKLHAPIEKGEKVGEVIVYNKGIEVDKIPLIAGENVKKANLFDRFRDVGKNWTKRKN
ncbi:MAG: D-alanyl-D-alanine carboxypeptidase [Clostridiales bacterium]|nr:D-alanyl-D-alanine carboxypeptidase [Clostridiales bacterium]